MSANLHAIQVGSVEPPADPRIAVFPGGRGTSKAANTGIKPTTRRLIMIAALIAVLIVAGMLLMRRLPESVSALMFVGVVIVEVMIAPIPGGAVAYMGAARFGFWQAWPLLYAGNAIGTTLVFCLARQFGAPLFRESVTDENRRRYDGLLQHHRVLLWLAYCVPVVPVDVLSVLAGVSSMSSRKFLTIALTGYLVYTGIVAFVGDFAAELVGTTEAVSALGAILLGALVWSLWRGSHSPTSRSSRVSRAR